MKNKNRIKGGRNRELSLYVLLALHNIALVGCAAAPFYNLRLTNQRGKLGPKIFGLEPYCWSFIILHLTGFGFPITYYAFHGALKQFSTPVIVSFIFKHLFVLGMVVLALYITFFINPKIKDILLTFSPNTQLEEEKRKEFFGLRAKQKRLCKICFVFALIVLIVSPILRFY